MTADASQPRGYLAVTIDTEEEGLWSGTYASEGTVTNIAHVPRFQDVCDRNTVVPSYLITTPVASDRDAIDVLKPIQDDGRCEIGTHVHPWNSPPIVEANSSGPNSFLCNLPPDQQRAKIEGLTQLIETNFGVRPVSFRAGRYGMDATGVNILRDLGYRVDSSVIPYTDYSSQSGPDFRQGTCEPYFPDTDSILDRGDPQEILEVPVSVGFTHKNFTIANNLRQIAMRAPFRQLKAVGILDRAGIASRHKLSPEQASLKQLKQLATAIASRGTRSLVLMFHSSSLKPGCSPYVKNEVELQQFLDRLDAFFEFCIDELNFAPIPLRQFYEHRNELQRNGSK